MKVHLQKNEPPGFTLESYREPEGGQKNGAEESGRLQPAGLTAVLLG
jgi:hypothetical protein